MNRNRTSARLKAKAKATMPPEPEEEVILLEMVKNQGSTNVVTKDKEKIETEGKFMHHLGKDTTEKIIITQRILVDDRYEILHQIGRGSYGNVFKATDKHGFTRAIKVIKSKYIGSQLVYREVHMLNKVNTLDPLNNTSFIVRLYRAACFRKHIYLIFDLLGPTLKELLLKNSLKGVALSQLREVSYQVILAINFLHSHGLVHNDIKPDNIAFVYDTHTIEPNGQQVMKRSDIRLIDLGSTVSITGHGGISRIATTRQYRSPEFTLVTLWSYSSDVWSVGCTMFEMYWGKILFPCEDEVEKFHMLEIVLEQSIPHFMTEEAKYDCFDEHGKLKKDLERAVRLRKKNVRRLNEYIKDQGDENVIQLFELLEKMLTVQPAERITTQEIFKHPFLKPLDF